MISIRPTDGVCSECGGSLIVTDANEYSMLVECESCGEVRTMETDAYGDGGIEYWPAIMAELEGGR